MATTYTTIKLAAFGQPAVVEKIAAEAITPGHLVYLTSAGKWAKHVTAGASNIKAFALENAVVGGAVGTAYAANDQCPVWFPRPGDVVAGMLAANENVAIGDKLESGTNGTLRKVVADASAGAIALNSVVGVAEEALNLTASGAAATLIRLRVI